MKYIVPLLSKFWTWLTSRTLEAEHIGMAGVIIVSTWHVANHMAAIEAWAIIAVIMGSLLGFLNALCAMRFFEEREEIRLPAGVGVLFFAGVSIGMQYGFYDGNSSLTPYMVGDVNVNALMFGAWAPVAEILIGWLYGARLFARGASAKEINAIKEKYDRLATELQAKVDRQLMVNQHLRDDLHAVKTTSQEYAALIAEKDALIEQLRSKVTELRVQNAGLDGKLSTVKAPQSTGDQRPVNAPVKGQKLTVDERRSRLVQMIQNGNEPVTKAGLARSLNVAVNTIKADLRELEDAGLIHVNGSIQPGNGHTNGVTS